MSDQQSPPADRQSATTSLPVAGRRSSASAPAKLILCGEHAVVYGRPAIAVPLPDVRARVTVDAGQPGAGITIDAPDLGRRWALAGDPGHPFSALALAALAALGVAPPPDLALSLASEIPTASGMGSGAAIATALVRALAEHYGSRLPPEQVSALVYESERHFHGTPSGIDNTVVAFERPIWFVRPPADSEGNRSSPTIEPVAVAAPLTLVVADTGVRSATRLPVGEVRRRWQEDPLAYEALFDAVAAVVARARAALAQGDTAALGSLLSQNHALLQQLGVSSPELDRLVEAACEAGALGAKLSGAGWGGVMLALAAPERRDAIGAALLSAGAARILHTTVV